MKSLFFLSFLLFITVSSNAQKSFSINENGGPSVTCDAISVDTENNIYEFTGNVNFTTADIHIEQAQKVTLYAKSRKVTASDPKKVIMTKRGGTIIAFDCKKNNLEYKLGRKRLVVNKDCR